MGGKPLPREVRSLRACLLNETVARFLGPGLLSLLVWPRGDPTVVKTAPIGLSFTGDSRVLFRDICQMGSLAGAAYLLHDNAGVLRRAQWEQKSHVEHKRKGLLD